MNLRGIRCHRPLGLLALFLVVAQVSGASAGTMDREEPAPRNDLLPGNRAAWAQYLATRTFRFGMPVGGCAAANCGRGSEERSVPEPPPRPVRSPSEAGL